MQPVRIELANPWVRNGRKTVPGVHLNWDSPKAKFSISPCLTTVPYPFKASPYTPSPETCCC